MLDTNTKWIKEISDHEILDVGYKAHILSELSKANFTLPKAFVIGYKNFYNFLQKNSLKEKIQNILKNTDFTKKEDIQNNSKTIQNLILKQKFDQNLITEILKMYTRLGESRVGFINTRVDEYVAIRSSLSSEEYALKDLDFIGNYIGFLNIKGRDELLEHLKLCLVDFYSPELIEQRYKKGLEDQKINLSLIVQKMIPGAKSGIMLTSNKENKKTSVIEAIYGFGGKRVIQEISPDHYEVFKKEQTFLKKTISKQEWMLKKLVGKTTRVNVESSLLDKQKLDQRDINELLDISKKLEMIYGEPMEVNWVIDANQEIFILSANPIDLDNKKIKKKKKIDEISYQEKLNTYNKKKILEGIAVSKGLAIGVVKLVKTKKDLEKINENTIFVTKMTTLEMSQTLRKAKGIITDAGSTICHAALISKKYDVPCVVHTERASTTLRDGQIVLVNGYNGFIYSVSNYVVPVQPTKQENVIDFQSAQNREPIYPKTVSEIFIEFSSLEDIKKINLPDIDGILLDIDVIFTSYEKGKIYENLDSFISYFLKKITFLKNSFPNKEIIYKINRHSKNLITKNVSDYELEGVIQANKNISILIENIKSGEEILDIKKKYNLKLGVNLETLNENLVEDFILKGVDFLIYDVKEIDFEKIKKINQLCKLNRVKRISRISEHNSQDDIKKYINTFVNGLIFDFKKLDYKDIVYKEEKDLLKSLLSV